MRDASEKEGQDLNTVNKSAVRGRYDPANYNFDYGVPNKGTPQIDQVFQDMTCWELLKKNVWYYYDGIAFFAFNDTKLNRIRRKPASIWDKIGSLNVFIRGSVISLIIIFIIV